MKPGAALLLAVGSVATAGLIGGHFGPQRPPTATWYASLRKPPYTPPGPLIGGIWGVLEILLCVTGYRLLTSRPGIARAAAVTFWAADLAGLAGFPVMFFGRKKLAASAGVASGLFASASATAATSAQVDPVAAVAGTPLVLWTAFATLLSEELWRRN